MACSNPTHRFATPVEPSVFVPETAIFAITVEKAWDVANNE
jgi:hypothetical protein